MKLRGRITQELAQRIVEAASQISSYDVNFISADGMIYASTNSQRIGTFHEAGRQAYELRQTIEVESGSGYLGARPGINYPIIMDGQSVGVIGISGDPEQCRSLGFLLTKTTELLIREQAQHIRRESADELRSAAARLLLFNEGSNGKWREALERCSIQPQGNAFVLLIGRSSSSGEQWAYEAETLLSSLLNSGEPKLYLYLFPDQYAVIVQQSDESRILHHIKEADSLVIGIGNCVAWEELAISFHQAKLALRYETGNSGLVHRYSDLRLNTLLAQLSPVLTKDFSHKRVGLLDTEELGLLSVYYKHNLSLKESAASLFIHKNTMQYRLDKIAKKTGLDPRQYDQSVELYLALLLHVESDENCTSYQ